MRAVNPVSNELIQEYPEPTADQVDQQIHRTHRAAAAWGQTPLDQRLLVLRSAAEILRRQREELGWLMAREMGKPIRQGEAEADKCAWVCEYYADQAGEILRPRPVMAEPDRSYVAFRPLGTILAVMPWNFPLWQVFRFLAPALAAGNAALLKHAGTVPGCALAIGEILKEAGLPPDVLGVLLIPGERVGRVIDDVRVAGVTLTGSTPAGRAVAARAGAALKKTVLELGGSDPYIILEDADLDRAVPLCVTSRLINSGQSCIAAKRFIVVDPIREEFERRFVTEMAGRVVGDPMEPETEVGPMARRDLRDELHQQVFRSVRSGARLLLGGEIPPGPGAFYPPTVLTDVAPDSPAAREELFGPVAAILPVSDETEAIRVANDTVFGLGAAVFTADSARGERIAREGLQAGSCCVNTFVSSDPRLPFGGIRESGYGRELAEYGLLEFVNIKTVTVAAGGSLR